MKIVRYETPFGTFGELTFSGISLHTLERKWHDNMPNMSCIPAGEYALVPHHSPKWGDTWAIVNERYGVFQAPTGKGRWGILIHPANLEEQLQGCIAVGERLGLYKDKWSLVNSRKAYNQLLATLADYDYVKLEISYKEHPQWKPNHD